MTGTRQPLTDRETELLDYYRTVMERVSPHKTEEDGGTVPDGFGGNHSADKKPESQETAQDLGEQSALAGAVVPFEVFEHEEVER